MVSIGFFFKDQLAGFMSKGTNKKDINNNQAGKPAADVIIKQQWSLPPVLVEISGLAYIDKDRFACVQDEAGTIFIYNTATASIEKEIPFTGPGDFEGIALKGNTAYITRSDGRIFEVDLTSKKTNEYATFLTAANNVESLFYDAAHNRLLLAGKEPDSEAPDLKNVYAFDLASKDLLKEPIVKIDLRHPSLTRDQSTKKKKRSPMPSAIALHPATRDIYILDGPKSRLLVSGNDGTIKNVYELGKEFYKPEGISFSPEGTLFISNEGKKMPGNIMEVEIR